MFVPEHQDAGRPNPATKLLTTSARASAAAEQYWQQHASSTASSGMGGSSSSIGSFDGAQLAQQHRKAPGKELQAFQDGLPGGEKELAQRTREACWRDSVPLKHVPGTYMPTCQGTPQDLEEKERGRTRGIPGYTGCQPPPGASRPALQGYQQQQRQQGLPSPEALSRWTAINGFDERRPRVKGIPGYTGHQPHQQAESVPGAATSAAANTTTSSSKQHNLGPSRQQQQAAAEALKAAMAAAASAAGRTANSPSRHFEAHQQRQPGGALLPQPCGAASTGGGNGAAERDVGSSGSGSSIAGLVQSRVSSPPRYFWNGVEVPTGPEMSVPHTAGIGARQDMLDANHVAVAAAAASAAAGRGGGYEVHACTYVLGAGQEAAAVAAAAVAAKGSGTSGSNGSSGASIGRPAIGPWCTTYGSTYVQPDAYKQLLQQFKQAALQRSQGTN